MKNQKGITLIALVVTIVVLLILAGTAIAMLQGDNGIVTQAQNASYANIEGEVFDNVRLAYSDANTEVKVETAKTTGYNAKLEENVVILANIVAKDLGGTGSITTTELSEEIGNYTVTATTQTTPSIKIVYDDGGNFSGENTIEFTINFKSNTNISNYI